MKRLGFLLAILVLAGFMSTSYAQKDRQLGNGFSINLVTGFPSAAYGLEDGEDLDDELKLGTMWGLQLGNRWYFGPTETFGVGLMANWVDFSISAKGGTSEIEIGGSTAELDWARAVIDFSFIELGPVATYALTEDIAIDGYYNLRPTVLSSALMFNDGDDSFVATGFGFTHAIGTAFRWKVLNIGLEYVMGDVKSAIVGTGIFDTGFDLGEIDNKASSFRIMIGAKF